MKRFVVAIRIVVSMLVLAFMALMSVSIAEAMLSHPSEPPERKHAEIITVWHVVRYKPYSGSVGTIITEAARSIEKSEYGVFFSVEAITMQEYQKRTELGEKPDVISFPSGIRDADGLYMLAKEDYTMLDESLIKAGSHGDALYALCYAQSPCVLIENNELVKKAGVTLPENELDAETIIKALDNADAGAIKRALISGRPERWAMIGACGECEDTALFKEGKAALCIDDIRIASDISALNEKGKGFNYTVHKLCNAYGNAQFIAISAQAGEWKTERAKKLISILLSEKYQQKLCSIGLCPAIIGDKLGFDGTKTPIDVIDALADTRLPNAFLLARYSNAIDEEAQRALEGDEQARASLNKRYEELCG